jgi:hypothetical protein
MGGINGLSRNLQYIECGRFKIGVNRSQHVLCKRYTWPWCQQRSWLPLDQNSKFALVEC